MIKIGSNISKFSTYSCQPKTKDELVEIISERTINDGYKCDLNDIDTSLITDMSWLFSWSDFNGNISKWDVSKVENMMGMFAGSDFNQDISNWKIRQDCDTTNMFAGTPIKIKFKPKL